MSLLATIYYHICRILKLIIEFATQFFSRDQLVEFDNERRVKICKKLAEGGFSVVFEACDSSAAHNAGLRYALKRVICGDKETIDKCRKEANIHRSFDHPNLLPILSLKFDNNTSSPNHLSICYMLFPLLNLSIRDEINRRGYLLQNVLPHEVRYFEPREIIEIFAGILNGVNAMHERGYTHRDIKVENVMLDSVGNPILMDFGSVGPEIIPLRTRSDLLNVVDEASSNTTMPYRAPELFDGGARYGNDEPDIDGRVDVWSLGCVLFAMMYGASPFECEFRGDNVKIVECTHLRVLGKIPEPEPLSIAGKRYSSTPELSNVVNWLLTKDRTKRPQMEEIVTKVDSLLVKHRGAKRWISMSPLAVVNSEQDYFV